MKRREIHYPNGDTLSRYGSLARGYWGLWGRREGGMRDGYKMSERMMLWATANKDTALRWIEHSRMGWY